MINEYFIGLSFGFITGVLMVSNHSLLGLITLLGGAAVTSYLVIYNAKIRMQRRIKNVGL